MTYDLLDRRKDEVFCAGWPPAKMAIPPWSHSVWKSAETVTSQRTNGCLSLWTSMGAVTSSSSGDLLPNLELGGAVREKYSLMSSGCSKSAGGLMSSNSVAASCVLVALGAAWTGRCIVKGCCWGGGSWDGTDLIERRRKREMVATNDKMLKREQQAYK